MVMEAGASPDLWAGSERAEGVVQAERLADWRSPKNLRFHPRLKAGKKAMSQLKAIRQEESSGLVGGSAFCSMQVFD